MSTGLQVGLLIASNIIALLAIVVPLYQRGQNNLKAAIDKRFESVEKRLDTLTSDYNSQALQINTILEGRLTVIDASVKQLTSGQDDWSKEIRQRTHELAKQLDKIQWEWGLVKEGRLSLGKDTQTT